jgi:hypothetical protein
VKLRRSRSAARDRAKAGDESGLICPRCRRQFAEAERFCPTCGLPLARPAALEGRGEEAVSELHRQARKVKPQYAEGKLVRVTGAQNQPEGELVRELLLEAGVPSMLSPILGLGADLMAGAPCDVMVPEGGLEAGREALLQHERHGL